MTQDPEEMLDILTNQIERATELLKILSTCEEEYNRYMEQVYDGVLHYRIPVGLYKLAELPVFVQTQIIQQKSVHWTHGDD